MSYTIDRFFPEADFTEIEARTRKALMDEKFGVVTEIDLAATMKAKLGKEMPAYKILGACNPGHAFAVLTASPRIGAMLPCNVIVRATEAGVEVSAVDPVASFAAVTEPGAQQVAAEVREIYARVVAAI